MFAKKDNNNCFWQKKRTKIVKKTRLVLFFISLVAMSFSQDITNGTIQESLSIMLGDLFSDKIVQDLRANGKIQRNFYGEEDVELTLWPNTDLGRQASEYWQRKDDPIFIVESLYLLKKSDEISKDNDIERISAILRSPSRMQGMEYYSNTRKSYEILYSEVYTVNNLEEKMRVDDLIEGSADGLVSYVYQDDLSLGGAVYKFSYFQNENEVSFRAFNAEKFYVVKPENLVITLIATDVGDSIAFYILVQADVPRIPFVSVALARSFSARADAIYNWCVDMYTGKL